MTLSPPDLVLCSIICSIRSPSLHRCSVVPHALANLCVHLVLCSSPSIICPRSHASQPSLIYSSTMIPPSISQPSFHLHTPILHATTQHRNILNPLPSPFLTLHRGHFWAFLCPCSMTLAQLRSSLSPLLQSRHLTPLCHGAWHLKHHTNWQLLHWIYSRNRRKQTLGYAAF